MAPKPKLDASNVNPEVAARVQQIKDQAADIDRESDNDALAAVLDGITGMTPQKRAFILESEFDRKPQRQPKLSADGKILIRVNKKGETLTVNEQYIREAYADILPAEKQTAGEIDMALAVEAVKSITMQGQLVQRVGAAVAEKLLAMAGGQLGKVVEAPIPKKGSNGKLNPDNPWSYPPGDAEGDAARADFIRKWGSAKSTAKARELNVDLAGRPLKKVGA